ncbi:MAG: hypothetical protein AAFQ65_16120 [Myxococcota bacterium]
MKRYRPGPLALHPLPLVLSVALAASMFCGATETPETPATGLGSDENPESDRGSEPDSNSDDTSTLGVIRVTAAGENGRYRFSTTLLSGDTGCEHYADWWEVLTPEGELLYRRILAHSHVDEQPFTRSGGPVAISASRSVIVRAHTNDGGYLPQAMRGSVEGGFEVETLDADFARSIERQPPQPDRCAF